MNLKIKLEDGVEAPKYAHEGDAGLDLRITEDVWLHPGERKMVPTGVRVAIPEGYVGLLFPRSGLSSKQGISLSNCVGVVDATYRGGYWRNACQQRQEAAPLAEGRASLSASNHAIRSVRA